MHFNPIKLLLSQKERKKYKQYKKEQFKLFMTLIVRDEEEIIEQNIRFHMAMGVDGFIVISHNSTDNTNAILEKLKNESIVKEIIYKTDPDFSQITWVNEMVKIAKDKYHADWIINADADEFFYSTSLNLKKSITESEGANVIIVNSLQFFPHETEKESIFHSCYFVTRPLHRFEAEQLRVLDEPYYAPFVGEDFVVKALHKTEGFISDYFGNHGVKMKNRIKSRTASIKLYHYHIKGYKGLEHKVKQWEKSIFLLPKGKGAHMKPLVKCYQEGKLLEEYNKRYGKEIFEFVLANGIVTFDPSVYNFMKYMKLL